MQTYPGFVDLQVNGCRGVDFSSPDLTRDGIEQIGRRLMARGVAAYCPAVITTSNEVYRRNLPLLADAVEGPAPGARILGVHLEGPFISPDDGPRGAHPHRHVRPPSVEFFEQLRAWARDRIVLMTLSVESPDAKALVRHVMDTSRVALSMGHQKDDPSLVRRGADLGIRACTHLGNGLPEMIHRHRNSLWTALADDRLTALVISDGHHVPLDMLRTLVRAKGPERIVATSDMSFLAGLPPGRYTVSDETVVLEPDGRLHREGAWQLAGGTSDLTDCMTVLAGLGELRADALLRIGRDNPLRLVGATLRQPPDPGDLVKFDGRRFEPVENLP